MTDVVRIENEPPSPDDGGGFSPEDLKGLIQKICEADAALSSLGVTLPIRDEARRFRERFVPELQAAEKSGRLWLVADALYKKVWAFYADHYLPALKLKEEIDKALRGACYINHKTGEKEGFAFFSKTESKGGPIWIGKFHDFTVREIHLDKEIWCGLPLLSPCKWAACWEKQYDLENFCPLFNVCPKLADAPWVYS